MYKKIFVTVSTKFDKFENNYNLAKRLNIRTWQYLIYFWFCKHNVCFMNKDIEKWKKNHSFGFVKRKAVCLLTLTCHL